MLAVKFKLLVCLSNCYHERGIWNIIAKTVALEVDPSHWDVVETHGFLFAYCHFEILEQQYKLSGWNILLMAHLESLKYQRSCVRIVLKINLLID